jgi:hypothetical protein
MRAGARLDAGSVQRRPLFRNQRRRVRPPHPARGTTAYLGRHEGAGLLEDPIRPVRLPGQVTRLSIWAEGFESPTGRYVLDRCWCGSPSFKRATGVRSSSSTLLHSEGNAQRASLVIALG